MLFVAALTNLVFSFFMYNTEFFINVKAGDGRLSAGGELSAARLLTVFEGIMLQYLVVGD